MTVRTIKTATLNSVEISDVSVNMIRYSPVANLVQWFSSLDKACCLSANSPLPRNSTRYKAIMLSMTSSRYSPFWNNSARFSTRFIWLYANRLVQIRKMEWIIPLCPHNEHRIYSPRQHRRPYQIARQSERYYHEWEMVVQSRNDNLPRRSKGSFSVYMNVSLSEENHCRRRTNEDDFALGSAHVLTCQMKQVEGCLKDLPLVASKISSCMDKGEIWLTWAMTQSVWDNCVFPHPWKVSNGQLTDKPLTILSVDLSDRIAVHAADLVSLNKYGYAGSHPPSIASKALHPVETWNTFFRSCFNSIALVNPAIVGGRALATASLIFSTLSSLNPLILRSLRLGVILHSWDR